MTLESKLSDPIYIRIGTNENIIMNDPVNIDTIGNGLPLNPGVIVDGEHYGFIIISDKNGFQKEVEFKTQCPIKAVGIENNVLMIYEKFKAPWRFSKKGDLIYDAFDPSLEEDDFYFSEKDFVIDKISLFVKKPTVDNPIRIKIDVDFKKSTIELETVELGNESLLLINGVMLKPSHYGFIICRGNEEKVYPTELPIDEIQGFESYKGNSIVVYELGKHHPWQFKDDGTLINKAGFQVGSNEVEHLANEILKDENEDPSYKVPVKK